MLKNRFFSAVLVSLVSSQALAGVIIRTEPLSDAVGILNLDLALDLGDSLVLGLDYSHGIGWTKDHESKKIYGSYYAKGVEADGFYVKAFVGHSTFVIAPSHTWTSEEVNAKGLLAGYQWAAENRVLWNLGVGAQHLEDRWHHPSIMPAFEFSVGVRL